LSNISIGLTSVHRTHLHDRTLLLLLFLLSAPASFIRTPQRPNVSSLSFLVGFVKASQDGDPRSEDHDPGMLQQQQQLQHQSMQQSRGVPY
jgi:hypothetical protein